MRSNNTQVSNAGNYHLQATQNNYINNYAELNHDGDYDEQEYEEVYRNVDLRYYIGGKYSSAKGGSLSGTSRKASAADSKNKKR